MQSLVVDTTCAWPGQEGVIWLPPREDVKKVDPKAIRFVFESEYMNPAKMFQYQIHEMHLYSDFYETLRKLGYLPEVTVDKVVELELELEMLKKALEVKCPELLEELKVS